MGREGGIIIPMRILSKKGDADMSGIVLHEYEIKIKGVKKKVVYHFSDVHITESDSLCSEAEIEKLKEDTERWLEIRARFAKKYGEPCDERQQITGTEHFENMLSMANADGDIVCIAGDLFNSVKSSALRTYEQVFSNTLIPYLYVAGNHEQMKDIPDDCAMAEIKKPIIYVDLGDLIFVGVNNSQRIITREQIDKIKEILALGKPVIIVMHIPILTEGNEQLEACSEYFKMNVGDVPAENHEFVEFIKQNDEQIAAIFAGHLHFKNNFAITPRLTQYVSSQGILGNVNRYVIGE